MANFTATFIRCTIHRDIAERISNSYPAHEVAVLSHSHKGRISLDGPALTSDGDIFTQEFDEAAEMVRLQNRYGDQTVMESIGQTRLAEVVERVEELQAQDYDNVMSEREEAEVKAREDRATERRRELQRRADVVRERKGSNEGKPDSLSPAQKRARTTAANAEAKKGALEATAQLAVLRATEDFDEAQGAMKAIEAALAAAREAAVSGGEKAKEAVATAEQVAQEAQYLIDEFEPETAE